MTNKIVFILAEEGDEQSAAYVNGEYTVGEYYFSIESIVWTAKKLDPNVEIEYWEISQEMYQDLNGLPAQLPDHFVQSWDAIQKFLNP